MRISTFHALAVGALLAVSAGAAFADQATQPQTQPQSVSEILTLQHGLRDRLERPSGEYSRFSSAAIQKMEVAQDKVFRMLDGVKSLDELNPEQKTELSNSLDEIKSVLLANEGSRQICHRERRTGSNIIELRCETMASREARARESQQQLMDSNTRAQTEHGG